MWPRLLNLFPGKRPYAPGPPPRPRVVLTLSCVEAINSCMEKEIQEGREGVAYIIGQTDGTVTLAVSAVRPDAETTTTSFFVSAPAMAKVVRVASEAGLQLVGQVHTHPGDAYHSVGDEEGAQNVYQGFVSVVLPDYGRRLPSLEGSAVYMFRRTVGFVRVAVKSIGVVPGRLW